MKIKRFSMLTIGALLLFLMAPAMVLGIQETPNMDNKQSDGKDHFNDRLQDKAWLNQNSVQGYLYGLLNSAEKRTFIDIEQSKGFIEDESAQVDQYIVEKFNDESVFAGGRVYVSNQGHLCWARGSP